MGAISPIRTRLVVHLGRHKTGTSSLQHTLNQAKSELALAGWTYPLAGRDPHGAGLPTVVAHHALGREALKGVVGGVTIDFRQELARSRDRIIVSSEGMQNVPASNLAAVFRPGETTIVIYLREQVSYILSGYAQFVQAQDATQSFETYARRVLKSVTYHERLSDLAEIYGEENVVVRIYEPSRLVGGGTVEDFLSLLQLEGAVSVSDRDSNPSIGARLVLFKRIYNALGLEQSEIYGQLGTIVQHGKFGGHRTVAISPGLQGEIRDHCAESNSELFDRWVGEPGGSFELTDFSRPADLWTSDELVELFEQATANLRTPTVTDE